MLKKIIAFIIVSLILFSSFSIFTSAYTINESHGNIGAYYLYNVENDRVMASKNLDTSVSASSTVKMMTALVVLESGVDLSSVITVTNDMIKGVSGRFMGLESGDRLTILDLLYSMVCASFNDAAQSLAISVGRTLDDFVELMNNKARELGMNNTFYADVSGMSNASKTTVSDTVKLVQKLISNEAYINIASTKSYQLSDYATCEYKKITNRSSLMTSYKGLANLNVGSTENDGDNAISYYNNGKLSFITIVMGAVPSNPKETENIAEKYTKSLLNHALYDNSLQTVLSKNQAVAYLPVKYTITNEKVGVYLAEDLKVYLPNDTTDDDNIAINYYLYDDLKAPLKAGDEVGVVTVSLNGRFLTSAPLHINKTVERNAILYIIESAQDFLLSGTFLLILLSFALLLVLYYFYRMKFFDRMYRRYEKKKKRYVNK